MNCDLLGTVAGIETGLDLELTRILHPCSQDGARNISFPRCSQHRPTWRSLLTPDLLSGSRV